MSIALKRACEILQPNVIKLSGLFVRLRRSRVFIGMNIHYKYTTGSRSNVLNLMTLARSILLSELITIIGSLHR